MDEIDALYESICELSDLKGEEWDEAIASIGDTIAIARGALYDRLMPKGYEWPRWKHGAPMKEGDRFESHDGASGEIAALTFDDEGCKVCAGGVWRDPDELAAGSYLLGGTR